MNSNFTFGSLDFLDQEFINTNSLPLTTEQSFLENLKLLLIRFTCYFLIIIILLLIVTVKLFL